VSFAFSNQFQANRTFAHIGRTNKRKKNSFLLYFAFKLIHLFNSPAIKREKGANKEKVESMTEENRSRELYN